MKYAYLVLAHNNPQQLERLLNRLQDPAVEFYIHVDKKCDISSFLYIAKISNNIHFINERYKVFHRGYASINATLALLKAAQRTDPDYNILMSGADYPIKSNQYIKDFLFDRKGAEFISFFRLQDRPAWLKKVEQYFYWDSIFTQFNGGVEFTSKRFRRLQKKLAKRIPNRKFIDGLEPYGGSQWWMISDDCARFVIDYIEGSWRFRQFFRFTDVPNELVFQTVILNSPFARKVMNWSEYDDEEKRKQLHSTWPCPASVYNFRYIDWTPERQSGSGHPVTLDEQDFDCLEKSHCLFARKMDSKKSAALMNRIDKELLKI